MVAGLAGRMFAFFADLMRRLAVVLDRAAGRPEPALALLMQRFPGAPEQWLRDIAARMPQFVEDEPLPPPPPLDIPREARRKPVRFETPADADLPPASPLSLRKDRNLRRYPRVKFHDVHGLSDHPEALRRDAPSPTTLRPQTWQEAASRGRPQPLRLSLTAPRHREKPAPGQLSSRPAPVLHLADRGPATAVEPLSLSPRATATHEIPLAMPSPPAPTSAMDVEWSGSHRSPATTLSLASSARKPAPEPHWIAAVPKTRAGFFPLSYERRWPELPQVIHSVRDERLSEPRFDELRREQEEGLWNG